MNANFIVIFTDLFSKLLKFWVGFSNSVPGSVYGGSLTQRSVCQHTLLCPNSAARAAPAKGRAAHRTRWTAPMSSPARPVVTS